MSDEPAWAPDGQRACAFCGRRFTPHAPTMKYCTNLCRHRAGAVRQGAKGGTVDA